QHVDVHDRVLRGAHLHVLDDRSLGLVADLEADDRRIQLLVVDQGQHVLMVEGDLAGREIAAVEDGRNLAVSTQAAARTLALIVTEVRLDLESDTHELLLNVNETGTSATRRPDTKISLCTGCSPTPRRVCDGWSRPAAPPPTVA